MFSPALKQAASKFKLKQTSLALNEFKTNPLFKPPMECSKS